MINPSVQDSTWHDQNQRYLVTALAVVRAQLKLRLAQVQAEAIDVAQVELDTAQMQLAQIEREMDAAPALTRLCQMLILSNFEREVLLLCAGMELESSFAQVLTMVQGSPQRAYPTFSLAMAGLAEPHWSALAPHAPLRKHELIEFANSGDGNAAPLTTRPIRITERALHYLVGITHSVDDRLRELAERIDPRATWDDLILPEAQLETLRTIVMHVRQRDKVYGEWGFAKKSARGLGIAALFAGASGTGKTLAAEVLAHTLALDLYRIDLSAVISKYIGETEKNLRKVFEAAEHSGAILLFDEADALFGKRSEVKDSHDRYANIEVGYLLQQIEAYRGLAILTTNLKHSLDVAFKRRIRFEVTFPFPDQASRARIWARAFPDDTPKFNLNCAHLAQLNVAGGNIRNIALNAAFLAANDDQPVAMWHCRQAAQMEYAKLDRPLTAAELAGWVMDRERRKTEDGRPTNKASRESPSKPYAAVGRKRKEVTQ